VSDAPFPAAPEHRDLTPGEQDALRQEAFAVERAIIAGQKAVSTEMWKLAEHVYRFHEGGMWGLLGYDTLEEFLAQPEVTMRRTQFFRLSKAWRDLVVTKQIPVSRLEQIEPSKVHEVTPAIMRGEKKVDEALADAESMGVRDLRIAYDNGSEPEPGDGVSAGVPGGSGADSSPAPEPPPLDDEAVRVECPTCHSMVVPEALQ
jgi:hypothetical protein